MYTVLHTVSVVLDAKLLFPKAPSVNRGNQGKQKTQ